MSPHKRLYSWILSTINSKRMKEATLYITNKKVSIIGQSFEDTYLIGIFLWIKITDHTLKSDLPCVYAYIP